MPLPAAPTLLLAVGAVMLVLSRWIRSARVFEAVWLASILGTVWLSATSRSPGLAVWIADPLALAGQSLVLVLGTLFGIASFGYWNTGDQPGERFGFLSFQTAGLMLVAQANDAITLALSVELVQFASLALRKIDRRLNQASPHDPEWNVTAMSGGDSSLWTGIVASLCLWLGIGLLSHVTASTNYDQIRLVLADAYQSSGSRVAIGAGSKLGLLGIGLMVAGLGSRIGLVPWQMFLNHATEGLGYWTAGSVLLSNQLAGVLSLCRLCGTVWIGYRNELIVLLMVLAGLTFLASGSLSILGLMPGEGRIARWLVSWPMLHGAWMTVGLVAAVADLAAPEQSLAAADGQPGALALLLFAAGANLVALAGLFLLFSYLTRENREIQYIDELLGLSQLAPGSATALMLLLASLAGQPPLWGFWGYWLLTVAGFNVRAAGGREDAAPHLGVMLVVIAAIIGTLTTAGVAIRFARIVILEDPISRVQPRGRRASLVAACLCALVLVVIGIAPARLLTVLTAVHGPISASGPDSRPGTNRGQSTAEN